jgi:hypothetical protein
MVICPRCPGYLGNSSNVSDEYSLLQTLMGVWPQVQLTVQNGRLETEGMRVCLRIDTNVDDKISHAVL